MAQDNTPQQDNAGQTDDAGRRRDADQQQQNDGSQPGVLGDWTEEQNLGQPGNPDARIKKDEVEEAFRNSGDPKH